MAESMVEALRCGGTEAKIVAARRLCELKSKQRHELGKRGVIEPLIAMLQARDYEAVEAALFALLSLASGSQRNKINIAKSGAIPVLIELLQSQTGSIFDHAIAALLVLSSCTSNKQNIANSGVIELLAHILIADIHYTNTISFQAKLDTLSTLQNLSTSPQIILSIASSSTVSSLIQLIISYEKSSDVVEKAMELLERIISSSEIALEETGRSHGSIQAIVEALEEGSAMCKEHAVGVLVAICQSCRERYRAVILREGVMPGLLQLSVDGSRRGKEMARTLLLILRDGSCPGSKSRQRSKSGLLVERVMLQIDADERVGSALRLVEETIAQLSV